MRLVETSGGRQLHPGGFGEPGGSGGAGAGAAEVLTAAASLIHTPWYTEVWGFGGKMEIS